MWWIILSIIIFYIHRIENKNYLVIYNNQGYYTCDIKEKPNDIFESGNIIVTVEKNIVEVFEFSQDNNNNILIKKSEINIDNSNSDNNNNNINNNINNNNFFNNNMNNNMNYLNNSINNYNFNNNFNNKLIFIKFEWKLINKKFFNVYFLIIVS